MEAAQAVGVGDGGYDTADGVGVGCPAFVDLYGGNLLDRYVLDYVLENVESVRGVGLDQDETPPLCRACLPLGGDGLIQGGVYPSLEFPLPVVVRVHEPHHRKSDGGDEGCSDGCPYEDECASALHGLHGPVVCVCGAVPRREWLGCRTAFGRSDPVSASRFYGAVTSGRSGSVPVSLHLAVVSHCKYTQGFRTSAEINIR